MKNLTKILLALLVVLTISCAKDGATGPQGPPGTNGTNGTDGNANVTIYNFETDFVLSPAVHYKTLFIPGLSEGKVDSSIILCYYKDATSSSNLWYSSPGLGRSADYQTRFYSSSSTSQTNINFYILDADGSAYTGSNVTISKVKIIVVPATTLINLRTKRPLTSLSYEEVCSILNIKVEK